MKRFSEQFQKKAHTIRITAAETRDLRERVVSYMEYHPHKATVASVTPATLRRRMDPVLLVSGWNIVKWFGGATAGLFLMVTYLAEQAVPGDSLYSIKVSFNEEVRSTLAFTPYEKVVWETERLNRRIAEARVLASEGRLTEAAEAEVVKAVKAHSDNARREIAILKETDEEEAALASLQLTTSIEVQTTSLRNNDTSGTVAGNSTALLASALALSESDDAALSAVVLPSYARLSAHIEQETTRAYELLNSVSSLATQEEQVDIKRRMEDIDRSVAEAITLAAAPEQDTLARQTLLSAIERTQRLIVFMTNIDVRQSVTVEEIVPVTLTKEERLTNLRAQAADNLENVVLVEGALAATSTAVEITEKLSTALPETRSSVEAALLTLSTDDFDLEALEVTVEKDRALLADAASILQVSVVMPPVEVIPLETTTATETASTTSTSTPVESEVVDTASDTEESVTATNTSAF